MAHRLAGDSLGTHAWLGLFRPCTLLEEEIWEMAAAWVERDGRNTFGSH